MLSIAGDISGGAATYGIVKDGLGTLILAGSDTYTGETSVNAGTLIVASVNALPDGSNLAVAPAVRCSLIPLRSRCRP